eukprot:4899201-Pyramimonas_sp.AAC.1
MKDYLQYEFFANRSSKIEKNIAEKLEACGPRTALPLGGLKVPVMHAPEQCPHILDATEVITNNHSDDEMKPTETKPSGRFITRKWSNVELQHAYHLDPEQDGKLIFCREKAPRTRRGQWIQQN